MEPLFLTRSQVLAFHRQQLERFGSAASILDSGLLESALAQPENTHAYDAHADLHDLAAAYAFHLVKNHPFQDGNKRTALHTALAFLKVNGITIRASQDAMYDAVIRLTTSEWSKQEFAFFLRTHAEQRAP